MHGNYYHMAVKDGVADLTIYGDISTWDRWDERSTSAYTLSKRLEELKNVKRINVNINSLGGDVKEGVAIYNALQRHPAKVVTRCDGWACSIASVIFMAGEERIMYPTSLLMIHNAWTSTWGANAAEMRKLAEDLDTITASSKAAYMEHISLTEEELTAKMDAETWVNPENALAWGFATKVEKKEPPKGAIHQSMGGRLFEMLMSLAANGAKAAGEDDDDDDSTDADTGTDTDDDTDTGTDGDDDGDGDGGGSDDDPQDPDPDDGDDDDKDTKNEAARTMAAFFMSMKN